MSGKANGGWSVGFEPGRTEKDGRARKGKWRATYRDADGEIKRVSATTRVQAEVRRSEKFAKIDNAPKVASRFSRDTRAAELIDWWLESVARHQVKTTTFDSSRHFGGYLADDIDGLAVVEVGAVTITAWQSKLLDRCAPFTVLNCRKVCQQSFGEAVKFGLIPSNPFDLVAVLSGLASERSAWPCGRRWTRIGPNTAATARSSHRCSRRCTAGCPIGNQ